MGLGFQICSSHSAEVGVTRKDANWSCSRGTSCVGTILQSGPISRDSSRDVLRVLVMFMACLEIGGCIQICVFVFGEDEGRGKYDRETRVTAHKENQISASTMETCPQTKRLAVCPGESWLPCQHCLALFPMKLIAWHSGSNYLQAPICFHREECLSVWEETFLYPFCS